MNLNKTFDLGGEQAVNRLGYGAMRLTDQPGNFGPYPHWQQGKALLRRAADLGVDFVDSAHAYGPEWADRLVGEALQDRPEVMLATKGGVSKPAPGQIVVDGSPATLLQQIDQALVNLKRDRIDLFQLHRVDPNVPIEESVAALAQAKAMGKIRWVGLSNVNKEQLDRALSVTQIASVQNRYNLTERSNDDLVDYTQQLGIAFIPYGPLGAHPMQPGAKIQPQLALAWLLQRSPNMLVIPGTTSIAHLEQNQNTWDYLESHLAEHAA